MPDLESKLESVLDLLVADLVDDRERFCGPDGELWLPVGGAGQGRADRDLVWTPEQYARARSVCRWLVDENPFAVNGVENRINYVVGTGHEYLLGPRRGFEVEAELLAQTDRFLEDFRRENCWHARQIEIMRRIDRDGEAFIRLFGPDAGGMTRLRFIEPEQVRSPVGRRDVPFGIEFAAGDVETPVRYYLGDEQDVDASDVQHRKANVDANAPRGIPLYWPVRRNLKRVGLLLRNMGVLTEVQSAFALIRKHKGTSISRLEAMAAEAASGTITKSNGSVEQVKRYGPGTILDVPASVEYEFPGTQIQASGMVGVLQAELRAIAARLVMPEFMFTSDAANAAYASTLVAEGPAVRMFQRLQQQSVHDDLWLLRAAIERAVEAGRLPPAAAEALRVTAVAPSVQVRDFLKEGQLHRLLYLAGVLSPQTWAQRVGLDFEREQTQLRAYLASVPPLPAASDLPSLPTNDSPAARASNP